MGNGKIIPAVTSMCLILILLAIPLLVACAQPAPTTVPATAPAPTQTPTAPVTIPAPVTTPAPTAPKVIELKYADQDPATSWANENVIDPWLSDLGKASKGRVKVTAYHAQTLCKGPDLWDAAKYGLSDISWFNMHNYPGQTPLADVACLPFAPIKSGQQQAIVMWQLFEKFPEMKQSFERDNKVLCFFANLYPSIATTPKAGPVRTAADLKGKKIRCPGALPSNAIKLLGAVPTYISAPDLYMSLQKGTIDGLMMSAGFAGNFRLDEVLLHYSLITLVGNYFVMAMNWDTWNKKLPADVKEAWEKEGLIHRGGTNRIGGWVDGMETGFEKFLIDHGSKYDFYTVPEDEAKKWREVGGKPLWDEWVKGIESKGLPGQKIYDEYFRLLAETK